MHGKNIAQIFLTLIREICIAGYYPGYVFFIFISFYMCISVDRFIFFTATLWHLNAGISWSVGMVDVTTSGLFSFVFFLFSCSKMFVCDLFFFECSSDCYLSSTILEIGAVFLSWLFVLYLIYRMSPGPGRQDASSLVSFWTFLAWHDISSSTSPPWGLNRIRVPTHFTDSVTKCCFLHTHTHSE